VVPESREWRADFRIRESGSRIRFRTSASDSRSSEWRSPKQEVSTTCVSRWDKANFNRNESVFDPSAYADGSDSVPRETFEAKPVQRLANSIHRLAPAGAEVVARLVSQLALDLVAGDGDVFRQFVDRLPMDGWVLSE
jgi:hypothetical protein